MSVINSDLVFVGAFVLLVVGVGLYAVAVPQGDRRWWGLAALMAVLVVASRAIEGIWLRAALLDAGTFVAVALVWIKGTPEAAKAARTYVLWLIPAVICIAAGQALVGESATPPGYPLDRIAVGLLVVGFGLKLAMVPLYFWLPGVAEQATSMTTALIISVVDMAAFTELAQLRVVSPWVFSGSQTLWLLISLLSMFGGALLALAQNNIKRMLAYSTIDDMGYLLLGLTIGSDIGLAGALLGALSHALLKVLLFGAVGIAEQQTAQVITLDSRGLSARFPVSGAAFIIGALGMIGVPPVFGFVGRWRLYLAGAEYGGIMLVLAMVLATALALLFYTRAIHRVWMGPASEESSAKEPALAAAVLVVLLMIVLALGLFPGWLTGYLG